jgi:hypothetical protein
MRVTAGLCVENGRTRTTAGPVGRARPQIPRLWPVLLKEGGPKCLTAKSWPFLALVALAAARATPRRFTEMLAARDSHLAG